MQFANLNELGTLQSTLDGDTFKSILITLRKDINFEIDRLSQKDDN